MVRRTYRQLETWKDIRMPLDPDQRLFSDMAERISMFATP
jgi:hypothetical protein